MTTELDNKHIFICGSALKGQPDHQNLQSAKFIKTTKTLHSIVFMQQKMVGILRFMRLGSL